jgi:hypothetical protein
MANKNCQCARCPVMGVSIVMGIPNKRMVYIGKCQSNMAENWGYPYFRKPPSHSEIECHGCGSHYWMMNIDPSQDASRVEKTLF